MWAKLKSITGKKKTPEIEERNLTTNRLRNVVSKFQKIRGEKSKKSYGARKRGLNGQKKKKSMLTGRRWPVGGGKKPPGSFH